MNRLVLLATVALIGAYGPAVSTGFKQGTHSVGQAHLAYYLVQDEQCSRANPDGCGPEHRRVGVDVYTDYRLEDGTYLGSDYIDHDAPRSDPSSGYTEVVAVTVAGNIGWASGYQLGGYLGGLLGGWVGGGATTASWTWGTFIAAGGPWVGAAMLAAGGAA